MYNINWATLISNTLPYVLRKDRMKAWLYMLIKPIITLHNQFLSYRVRVRKDIISTGQTIYLEKYLNDIFDTDGIYITTNARNNLFLGLNEDGDQLYLTNPFESPILQLGLNDDYVNEIDFTVNVQDIAGKPTEINIQSQVNRYKLAGKSFNVNYYTPT